MVPSFSVSSAQRFKEVAIFGRRSAVALAALLASWLRLMVAKSRSLELPALAYGVLMIFLIPFDQQVSRGGLIGLMSTISGREEHPHHLHQATHSQRCGRPCAPPPSHTHAWCLAPPPRSGRP